MCTIKIYLVFPTSCLSNSQNAYIKIEDCLVALGGESGGK